MSTAYIETTIPSYYVAKPSSNLIQAARQTSTREWWDGGCSLFDLVTSLETLDEAAKGDQEMAAARQQLLAPVRLLTVTDESIALAERLVISGAGFRMRVMCNPDELLQNNDDY
jgi:hypothetical protein